MHAVMHASRHAGGILPITLPLIPSFVTRRLALSTSQSCLPTRHIPCLPARHLTCLPACFPSLQSEPTGPICALEPSLLSLLWRPTALQKSP